jgi:hypothetical protein
LSRFFSATTILLGLFLGPIALRAAGLGAGLTELSDPSVNTDPARLGLLLRLAILLRLLSGSVALRAAGPGARFAELNHFSVHARPALGLGRLFAILLGLFLGAVAFETPGLGLRRRKLGDASVHTDPASTALVLRRAIPLRFFLRSVALKFSGFGLSLG